MAQVRLLKTDSGLTRQHDDAVDSTCLASLGVGTTTAPTGATSIAVVGDIAPVTSGTGNVGTATSKFASVHAAEVVSGDIGFTDERCLRCGRVFVVGDAVVFQIVAKKTYVDGTVFLSQPRHVNCRKPAFNGSGKHGSVPSPSCARVVARRDSR